MHLRKSAALCLLCLVSVSQLNGAAAANGAIQEETGAVATDGVSVVSFLLSLKRRILAEGDSVATATETSAPPAPETTEAASTPPPAEAAPTPAPTEQPATEQPATEQPFQPPEIMQTEPEMNPQTPAPSPASEETPGPQTDAPSTPEDPSTNPSSESTPEPSPDTPTETPTSSGSPPQPEGMESSGSGGDGVTQPTPTPTEKNPESVPTTASSSTGNTGSPTTAETITVDPLGIFGQKPYTRTTSRPNESQDSASLTSSEASSNSQTSSSSAQASSNANAGLLSSSESSSATTGGGGSSPHQSSLSTRTDGGSSSICDGAKVQRECTGGFSIEPISRSIKEQQGVRTKTDIQLPSNCDRRFSVLFGGNATAEQRTAADLDNLSESSLPTDSSLGVPYVVCVTCPGSGGASYAPQLGCPYLTCNGKPLCGNVYIPVSGEYQSLTPAQMSCVYAQRDQKWPNVGACFSQETSNELQDILAQASLPVASPANSGTDGSGKDSNMGSSTDSSVKKSSILMYVMLPVVGICLVFGVFGLTQSSVVREKVSDVFRSASANNKRRSSVRNIMWPTTAMDEELSVVMDERKELFVI